MTIVGVHEAKTTLSQLLRRVAAGEEVVITNGGVPVARLVSMPRESDRRIGLFAGQFEVPEDFDQTIHNDPFDRLLIAQALAADMPILTGDPVLSRYGIATIDATI